MKKDAFAQTILSDAELDALFLRWSTAIFDRLIDRRGVPTVLTVIAARIGAAKSVLNYANRTLKEMGMDAAAAFIATRHDLDSNSDSFHRYVFNIGYGYEGTPIAIILESEIWMGSNIDVRPRDDPERREAVMVALTSFDNRKRIAVRLISRDPNTGNINNVATPEEFGPDWNFDTPVLTRFWHGYLKRMWEKQKDPRAKTVPVPKYHAEN